MLTACPVAVRPAVGAARYMFQEATSNLFGSDPHEIYHDLMSLTWHRHTSILIGQV